MHKEQNKDNRSDMELWKSIHDSFFSLSLSFLFPSFHPKNPMNLRSFDAFFVSYLDCLFIYLVGFHSMMMSVSFHKHTNTYQYNKQLSVILLSFGIVCDLIFGVFFKLSVELNYERNTFSPNHRLMTMNCIFHLKY